MGKFTQYKVELSQLKNGHHEQDFVCDTEFFRNMENTEVISADVKVHLDIEVKHEAYDCTFTFKGKLEIPCDRCLDPMDHDVDTRYHIVVKYGETYNDDADNVLIIPERDRYLNVAYMLYDSIMLTIPMRHVHPQGKCNRAMAAVLHKHHSPVDDEEIDELLEQTEDTED